MVGYTIYFVSADFDVYNISRMYLLFYYTKNIFKYLLTHFEIVLKKLAL